jgi:hypothetical protein
MTKLKGIMPKVYFNHLRIVATLVLLFPVGEEKGRTIRWLKKGTMPKVYFYKGTMPKVYFYHLRIIATLVLLLPVGE